MLMIKGNHQVISSKQYSVYSSNSYKKNQTRAIKLLGTKIKS